MYAKLKALFIRKPQPVCVFCAGDLVPGHSCIGGDLFIVKFKRWFRDHCERLI